MANRFEFDIQKWADTIRDDAVEALGEVAPEGAEGVRQIIHASETTWGRERVAGLHGPARPHAGRIEKGDMIAAVDYQPVAEIDPNVFETRWGWEDPQWYYLVQEWGDQVYDTAIEGMESLSRTHQQGLDKFLGDMDKITRNSA